MITAVVLEFGKGGYADVLVMAHYIFLDASILLFTLCILTGGI